MTDNLLPCPFCGTPEDRLIPSSRFAGRAADLGTEKDVRFYSIHCCGCGINNDHCHETAEAAVEAWNRRASSNGLSAADLLMIARQDQSVANLSGIDEAMDFMRHTVEWISKAIDRRAGEQPPASEPNVMVSREAARLGASALRDRMEAEAYHTDMAAERELRKAITSEDSKS